MSRYQSFLLNIFIRSRNKKLQLQNCIYNYRIHIYEQYYNYTDLNFPPLLAC